MIETVAQQDDPMKRPRRSGPSKARRESWSLATKAITAASRQSSASTHHVELPDKGEYVAARVVKVTENEPRPKTRLDGELWALALDTEPGAPGPQLPRPTGKSS